MPTTLLVFGMTEQVFLTTEYASGEWVKCPHAIVMKQRRPAIVIIQCLDCGLVWWEYRNDA